MRETFRIPVPWMDGTDLIVYEAGDRRHVLKMKRVEERLVCEFRDGEVVFDDSTNSGAVASRLLTPAERLCLSVLPKDFGIGRAGFKDVLLDPFWQMVLDQMRVNDVMEI